MTFIIRTFYIYLMKNVRVRGCISKRKKRVIEQNRFANSLAGLTGIWHLYFRSVNVVLFKRGVLGERGRGTATGWTVRGSNPGGGEIFRICPERPWAPPNHLYNGYRVFLGGKERPGRDADPSPLLVPWSRKSRAIQLLPLWAVRPVQSLSACTVQLYLYSPYWSYGLYRASVPVQ